MINKGRPEVLNIPKVWRVQAWGAEAESRQVRFRNPALLHIFGE